MLRTFKQHRVRRAESLDGRWCFEPADPDLAAAHTTIQVPSVWESLPGMSTYRGQAWYRRNVFCPDATHLRLLFGGVSHTADVCFDGEKVEHHYDAFTPFAAVVPGVSAGTHEVAVRVENTFGDHSCLHKENDYYTYGGITRPVEIQWVPDVYIDRLEAKPVRKWNGWGLDVAVRLRNLSDTAQSRTVRLTVAGSSYEAETVALEGQGKVQAGLSLEGLDVKAWSGENPELYSVVVELIDEGRVVDDLTDRVGFREVEVDGRKVLLNGECIRLRGYNRHEDHPQFGCAMGIAAMANDLEIMRDQGCNFVRTSHYPNDMRFLDLCDEMGFYVWEESHARTVDTHHPLFREQIGGSTREMIAWHFNHPSIIMWGCLNECDSHQEEGVPEYKYVIDIIRSMDDSRPVTFASNRGKGDLCFGMVDIVAVNWYVGWYRDTITDVKGHLEDFLEWLNSPESKGGSGKPMIVSEFGAGAIYGNRQANRSRWSEEYQCDLLDESLRIYLNHRDVTGVAVWQFCDVRVTSEWWQRRPRTMNNKGTVDEFRRPKLAYDVVKRRMTEAAAKES